MIVEEDIISGQMPNKRSLRDTKMLEKSLLSMPRNNIASVSNENEEA